MNEERERDMNDDERNEVPEESSPEETPKETSEEPLDGGAAPAARAAPEGGELDEEPTPEDVAAAAEEFVSGLLEAMGLEGEVTSRIEDHNVFVEVAGGGLGGLIGRRGQTLDAVQEVARTAVQRRVRARVRLLVDIEGYRARRRESLAEYARAMAERSKERGTEIELEAMNAYERKIVHDAVAEVEGASSFSEGEEPQRKVIVRGS